MALFIRCISLSHSLFLDFFFFSFHSCWHFSVSVTALFCFASKFLSRCIASLAHFPHEQMIHYLLMISDIFLACFRPPLCPHFVECYLFSFNDFRVASNQATKRASPHRHVHTTKYILCEEALQNNIPQNEILYVVVVHYCCQAFDAKSSDPFASHRQNEIRFKVIAQETLLFQFIDIVWFRSMNLRNFAWPNHFLSSLKIHGPHSKLPPIAICKLWYTCWWMVKHIITRCFMYLCSCLFFASFYFFFSLVHL